MTTQEKLHLLREEMKQNDIDAFVVFSADPHMSEYLPTEWQERKWLTGFTGSAGWAVITKDKAALWTDGRYFVQAAAELKDSTVEMMKDGVEGTPHYIDWIISEVGKGGKVAVNALATSYANWQLIDSKLQVAGLSLVDKPLLNTIWKDRGEVSKNEVYVHPVERAGRSVSEKLKAIREKMKEAGATAHIIASLDDVAWTLNLRGSDVEANPVFLGYIYLGLDKCIVFVDTDKFSGEAQQLMKDSQVEVKAYEEFFSYLEEVKNESVLISPNTNQSVFDVLKAQNTIVVGAVPGNLMKAQKNEAELAGFRTVMERDGVAMVKFLYWLTHNAGKEPMNEYSIGVKLREFRAAGKNFVGESFGSIVGYEGNGAIVHYSAPAEGSKEVTNSGSILVDSGGQYLEGTTDITRTLPLGEVSEAFKRDSTLVLQGMIRLSMVKFPKGTKGVHLDAIARMPLWMEGKDYAHGTGHGVGHVLNVHEGPNGFRLDNKESAILEEGMITTNEPGFYKAGSHGIRLENEMLCVKGEKNELAVRGDIISEDNFKIASSKKLYRASIDTRHLDPDKKELFLTLFSIYRGID